MKKSTLIVPFGLLLALLAIVPATATVATIKAGAFGCVDVTDSEQLVSDLGTPFFNEVLDALVRDGKATVFQEGEQVDPTDTEAVTILSYHDRARHKHTGFITIT
jgi:hypothetical protein